MRSSKSPLLLGLAALLILSLPARAQGPAPGILSVQKTGVAIQRNAGFECADLVDTRDLTYPISPTEAQDAARRYYGTQTRPADPNAPDPARTHVPNPGDLLHGPVRPGQDPRPPGFEDTQLPPEPGLNPPELTVRFESIESGLNNASQQLLILRVSKDQKAKSEWGVIASLRANEAFARRKLLEALGYKMLPAQLWPKLTIHFEANQDTQKKRFLDRLAFVSDRSVEDWVVSDTSAGRPADAPPVASDVTIRNLVLTVAGTSLDQIEWGIGKDFADIDSRPERFTDSNCALRMLLVPWVLLDIGEKQKINAYGWRMGEIQGDSIIFMHRFAKLFRNTTYTDVRRISMEIGAKPEAFWTDVMKAAKLPEAVTQLLIEKVKSRRNDLMRLTDLRTNDIGGQSLKFKVDQKITIPPGSKTPDVKGGKLLTELFPPGTTSIGWPHSFRAPDNRSPLTPPEIFRYIGIEAVAAGFEEAGTLLTDRFLSRDVQDAAMAHGEDMQRKLIDAIMNDRPFVVRVGQPWVKGLYGFNFNGTRRVVSGNYFGGDIQAAQQVDSFSFQASGGLFLGLDNIKHLPVGTVAQGVYSRSWLHQKPLDDPSLEIMKKAIQNDKTPIFGAYYFTKLALALKDQKKDTSQPAPNPDDPQGGQVFTDPLQKFLDTLADNESLTIADTLAGSAQTLIPITDLVDFKILGSTFGLTPRIGYQQAIIKKTKIQRKKIELQGGDKVVGLQIDVSSLPPHTFEIGFDVSYFAKLLSYAHGNGGGTGTTWSFQIPDPTTKEDRDELAAAITKILFWNDTELLMGTAKEREDRKAKRTGHKLVAKVKSSSNKLNLLFHQRYSSNTTATVAYQPPAPTRDEIAAGAEDFNPADRELDFWIDTKTLQSGNNFTSFLLSLIPKLQLGNEANNPQNNFLGSNKGTTVTTEAEFTDYRENLPQTSFESHVRGRTIKKDKLLGVIHTMISRLGPLGEKYNLRQEATDEFATIDTVQLYDVSELLTLKNEAFKKMRDSLQIHALADPNQGDDEQDLVLLNLLELEGSLDDTVTPARVLWGDLAIANGINRLRAWCVKNGAPEVKNSPLLYKSEKNWGPYTIQKFRDLARRGKVVITGDNLWLYRCVKPWMWELLDLRDDYIKRLKKDPKELYKTYTELASLVGVITKGSSFPQFLSWLGEANYGYQIRVSGFRVGSEQEGEMDIGLEDYASSTIGSATAELQGTLQSLIREKRLSPDTVTNLTGGLSGERAQ